MNRRAFVTGLGAVLAAPLAPEAQQDIPQMTDANLERLLLHVALPPLRLGVRVYRLERNARIVAEQELRLARMIKARLARNGWFN